MLNQVYGNVLNKGRSCKQSALLCKVRNSWTEMIIRLFQVPTFLSELYNEMKRIWTRIFLYWAHLLGSMTFINLVTSCFLADPIWSRSSRLAGAGAILMRALYASWLWRVRLRFSFLFGVLSIKTPSMSHLRSWFVVNMSSTYPAHHHPWIMDPKTRHYNLKWPDHVQSDTPEW